MATYKTRPGVVLTSICGEYFLVAARALLDTCPYVTQINETSAFLWKELERGADRETLMRAADAEYEIDDPEKARAAIDGFITQMLEMNYLLPAERKGE